MSSRVISGSEAYILRLQQQKAALAEFGVEAFRTDDLDALLTNAAIRAGEGLGVDRAKVLEALPSGDQLLVGPASAGRKTWWASPRSTPISADRLAMRCGREARWSRRPRSRWTVPMSRAVAPARHKSAINVIISGNDGPFGVLEVDSQHMRRSPRTMSISSKATPTCWRRRSTASGRTACWSRQRTRRQCCCTSSNTGSRTAFRSLPA